MTAREKFNAEEKKQRILQEAGFQCANCGERAISLAHRIAKTQTNIKKYGKEIIHHKLNLVPVCHNPNCNDAFNIGNHPKKTEALVLEIKRAIGWWPTDQVDV